MGEHQNQLDLPPQGQPRDLSLSSPERSQDPSLLLAVQVQVPPVATDDRRDPQAPVDDLRGILRDDSERRWHRFNRLHAQKQEEDETQLPPEKGEPMRSQNDHTLQDDKSRVVLKTSRLRAGRLGESASPPKK